MSRITKAIAEEVAIKLLAKRREKNEKRYEEISDIITAIQEAKVPIPIMVAFSNPKTKAYIENHNQVYLTGPGLNNDPIRLSRDVPDPGGRYSPTIQLEGSTALLVSKKLEVWKSNKDKNNELCEKAEATLLSLRTYKRVQDLFPEAAKFLPPVEQGCADLQCISSIVKEIEGDE